MPIEKIVCKTQRRVQANFSRRETDEKKTMNITNDPEHKVL